MFEGEVKLKKKYQGWKENSMLTIQSDIMPTLLARLATK
jgi:hypothetical protein